MTGVGGIHQHGLQQLSFCAKLKITVPWVKYLSTKQFAAQPQRFH